MSDSSKILDGRKVANEIKDEIATEVEQLKSRNGKVPHLAAILVGDDGASHTYVNNKIKACKRVGFEYTLLNFPGTISESKLMTEIDRINNDEDIDGLIVQLPLPDHISAAKVTEKILPEKDVDGFTNQNYGRITSKNPGLMPATPYGMVELLKRYKVEIKGAHCVMVGNSRTVGAPMSTIMAYHEFATVTVCHIHTKDLANHTKQADILIVAAGKPELITADMIKDGAVVVDVGITRIDADNEKGYELKGDVKFDEVSQKAKLITPVPGGVGPMTIASLLLNTLKAYKNRIAAI
ncbi:bifunctional 5,10-methylenetetrahydrofolate dehydrogenase/5,10-methenyltetrahydrofolate cyclohydrolase [Fulvivirga sp. RKSG066]|uniref:bifunctional 5,10-methylenetetrahydrofolate dehydrogenase/5,10-methenyltetrahydrofolate cyclohydrolase n=1 Tax=Fulvivirga aurantia TaxID=2529383 RepID=UPI0012BD63A5|nr:bifunctional 5,10-methylenetetrahydrofolate dehydrogenase/5,10-methenyltetrahydrofolate cyclohydrolase [Fulvivirga aurantia]MTI20545.1 bifunctional 5,10-methylenetetrahydrofolate dehydrogenase/5,10-methenyltetrahydrofolate cyclohydrolase [Fulvivirga aurantia]